MRYTKICLLTAVGGIALMAPADVPAKPLVAEAGPPLAAVARPEVTRVRDPLTSLRQARRISRAEESLIRARALFHLRTVRRRYGWIPAPGRQSGTPVLQQLSLSAGRLTGKQRRRANNLLARPTDGRSDQFGDGYTTDDVRSECAQQLDSVAVPHEVCVHWVETTADAPPLADLDANDIPDQVDDTIDTLDYVWAQEVVGMGYRAPKSDGGSAKGQGPSDGTDIYVADVGADRLFGYCSADRLPAKAKPRRRAPAYCVLDDDYSPSQFTGSSPSGIDALQVTAAHEFFHAIQFAYEYSSKDAWLKEGTAVWVEDELYDSVNANLSYLPDSQLVQPEVSLNAFGTEADGQDVEYGAWVFWRFLSEYFGTGDVIRQVWKATAPTRSADPTAVGALKAVMPTLDPADGACYRQCDPAPFREVFAEYGLWNQFPALYSEGSSYDSRLGGLILPFDAFFFMDEDYVATGTRAFDVDRLSTRTARFLVDTDVTATKKLFFSIFPPSGNDAVFAFAHSMTAAPNTYTASFPIVGSAAFAIGPQASALIIAMHNAAGSGQPKRFELTGELIEDG